MRLFTFCAAVTVAAMSAACSSGGAGSLDGIDPSGAFGSQGRATPALPLPAVPAPGGGTQNPPVDSGVPPQDTGTTPPDTGTDPPDTGPGDGACTAPSTCPGDPEPSADGLRTALCGEGECATQGRALMECIHANRVCSSEGTTDLSATLTSCTAQQQAYSDCQGG